MEDIKVLIADNNKEERELISQILKNENYSVFAVADARTAINKAKEISPQIIILEVTLPEMDGIEACKELRTLPEARHAGIMFLTLRTEDYTQIAALDAGADDYISKPIRPRVLLSRIKSLVRRSISPDKGVISLGNDYLVDKQTRIVRMGKKEISLSKKEFDLLELLASKPGKVYSRQAIHEIVWNNDLEISDRIIDVHIWKLRQKLGKDKIITLKGIGYKMEIF